MDKGDSTLYMYIHHIGCHLQKRIVLQQTTVTWRVVLDRRFNIVMDLFNALPGNSSVNTFQRATMEAMSQ
jgi:hypothetical protein